ncbi:LysR family transcriptional regulator [Bacillus sp. JJ1562]|uniref:LysR family transcriptional regulator n=1 Tax=Bacillus sp. JJ1562 TaxID=3122960 RepID=UPI003003467E
MHIEDLQAFVAVAEEGSLSEAARRLNHLQSNMTAKIKKLEAHYNAQLFFRSRSGMKLTQKGEVLFKQYKQLLLKWEETETIMQGFEPTLQIGAMESAAAVRLTDGLRSFHELHPHVPIRLQTGTTDAMVEKVCSGDINLAFVTGPINDKQVISEKIWIEEMVLIGNGVSKKDDWKEVLDGKSIIVFSYGCFYRSHMESLYQRYHLRLGETIEVGALETLVKCADSGLGITMMPRKVADRFGIKDTAIVPEEYRYLETHLITRKNYTLSQTEQNFLSIIYS